MATIIPELAGQTIVELVATHSLDLGQRYLLQNRGPAVIYIAELAFADAPTDARTAGGHIIRPASGENSGEFYFTPASGMGVYVWPPGPKGSHLAITEA